MYSTIIITIKIDINNNIDHPGCNDMIEHFQGLVRIGSIFVVYCSCK